MQSKMYLSIFLLGAILCVSDCKKMERLLLNDQSVVTERLIHLEHTVAILNNTISLLSRNTEEQKSTINQLKTENQHLLTENLQQATTMQQLSSANQQLSSEYQQQKIKLEKIEQSLTKQTHGTTYVRWARTQCPSNSTELVYSGFAGGGFYSQYGASAEPVCLPPDPDFERTSGSDYASIYGAEFDTNFFIGNGVSQDVPCAVCRVIDASSVIMIPGKNKCYNGWNMEYHGYLAANNNNYASAGSYTCIDMNPEVLRGGSANDNGKLFFEVLAKCGSLQCPPYIQDYPLTCVLCSK